MKIFLPQLNIGDTEGFTKGRDIFSREAFGKGLANLLKLSEDPIVLALDGPWGSGKTTFIKMWAGLLRKEKFPVIYFDAFANDFIDDAFLAIAGEVISISKNKEKENTPAYKEYLKSASKVGRILLRSGVKVGIKAATLGALEAADLGLATDLNKDVAKEASKTIDNYISGLLEDQKKEQESITHFRATLAELAVALSPEDNENKRPLVFIIDELDRCKPTFALELLEKIKHVFSVAGVHFVLVTNLHQLENSVRYSYGNEINAAEYLQKFYSFIMHLPGDGRTESDQIIKKFTSHLKNLMPHDTSAISFLESVARVRNFQLRTIERIFTHMYLAIAFTTSDKVRFYKPPIILAGLCILKVVEPGLFQKAKSGRLTLEEIYRAFRLSEWENNRILNRTEKWWTYCLAETLDENEDWSGIAQTLYDWDFDRKDIVKVVADTVVDRMELSPQ